MLLFKNFMTNKLLQISCNCKIVPYGNTKYYENGTFVCQHGQDECISDAYMLCSLYKWNGNLGDIS